MCVAFRRHDLFPNNHPLFVGDLGLANPEHQLELLHQSDLILALGTRLDDITSQNFGFPRYPQPDQPLVHCHPDSRAVGLHFATEVGLACQPKGLLEDLIPKPSGEALYPATRTAWSQRLREVHEQITAWPKRQATDGLRFFEVRSEEHTS